MNPRRWIMGLLTLVGYNWITMFGSTLVTVSTLLIAFFVLMGELGRIQTTYLGILTFMVLPGVFVGGLMIIPFGMYWERRKRRAGFPVLDFNVARLREVGQTVLLLTMVNLLIISTVSYKGVVFTESIEFCGEVCHTVMEPEFTAYLDSPHSRVECVKCHIGPGASWFARSKLSGVRQVFAVALDTYSKPIETPVHNLRPSKETCEQCHWPKKFAGDRVRVIYGFGDDEENTPNYSVLLMHIGGGGETRQGGIHSWHINPDKRTSYIAADEERQEIPWVQVTEADGTVTEYVAEDFELTPEFMAREQRIMDCMDCHNRPSHTFVLPDRAMNTALAEGKIDATLPYIKKIGVAALKEADGSESSLEGIGEKIRTFYETEYADVFTSRRDAIEGAVSAIQEICSKNVFPDMNIGWGNYPNHIGHTDFPGCFRCHDDSHTSSEGAVIMQDCSKCHALLAWQEEDPEIMKQLGIE